MYKYLHIWSSALILLFTGQIASQETGYLYGSEEPSFPLYFESLLLERDPPKETQGHGASSLLPPIHPHISSDLYIPRQALTLTISRNSLALYLLHHAFLC